MKTVTFLAIFLTSATVSAGVAGGKSERPGMLDLRDRCRKMLDFQSAIYDATKLLHKAIEGRPDKKPAPEDRSAAANLAKKERTLIDDMTKAVEKLKADGAAA